MLPNEPGVFLNYPFLADGYFTQMEKGLEKKTLIGGAVNSNLGTIGTVQDYQSKSGIAKIMFAKNIRIPYRELMNIGIPLSYIVFKNQA